MKNITNYINMAINFSILGLLIYLTIVIMDIKKLVMVKGHRYLKV